MPVGRHRVQKIHRRKNARPDRNLFALQPEGIARSVPLLVMRPDDRHHRIGKADPLQNLRPHQRVDLHLFKFFRRQAPGLRDDVFGHGQLADVVQQRRRVQSFHFARGHAQFLGHFDGVHPHPLQVVVRGVVLGFDGQRQRLDGAQVQGRHFFDVPLFVLQFSQIQPIRPVDQVDDGNDQQRRFPSELAVEPADHAGKGGAHQVVGERPEVAFHPERS